MKYSKSKKKKKKPLKEKKIPQAEMCLECSRNSQEVEMTLSENKKECQEMMSLK